MKISGIRSTEKRETEDIFQHFYTIGQCRNHYGNSLIDPIMFQQAIATPTRVRQSEVAVKQNYVR